MKEEGDLGNEAEDVANSRTSNNDVKEEEVDLPGPSQAKEPGDDNEMNGKPDKVSDESDDKDSVEKDACQSGDNASEQESEESVEVTHLDCNLLYKETCYAELCSFFNMFSSLLSMKPVTFSKLEEMLCTLYNDEVSPELVELHITLMRKIYLKFARADKFESALVKFCNACPSLESEAVQLQRRSYSDLSLSARLIILRALCESQFDCNVKFKENLFNTFQANELRLAPIGSDKNGLCYYYQQDSDLNIRVYIEEPDDSSGATWTLKAKSVEELLLLIGELKSPEFGKKTEGKCEENDEDVDEDEILNKSENNDDKDLKNCKKEKEVGETKPLPEVHLSEAEISKIVTINKRCSFFDIFKDASVLNRKKNEKEERKKNKERSKNLPPQLKDEEDDNASEEDEDATKDVDEETLMAIVNEDDRRVLPRRNAKNNAISNIKAFTSKNKTPKKSEKTSEKSKAVKHDFVATCEESSEEESDGIFDEEEEEEEPEDASDYEFTLYGEKPPELVTKTTKVVKKKKRGKKAGKKKSKVRLSSVGIAPHKRPNAPVINFESSDEEGVEEEEEELKERKKATEKTLCMQCRGSKRPDLLLLCDMCDDAWHTFCLKPSLWYVPDGDWFCPNCLHVMLVEKLSFALVKLQEALKLKECEDKKKQAAADRLKREMEYIGVSLHNVIPNANTKYTNELSESDESDEDDGQRKSKKRALKRVMGKSRHEKQQYYGPIVTIAEGRSRRALNKVDYNFHAYDEQLQEAMEIETPYKDEPPSGLGRGKDMANIIEAERKRKASEDHGVDNNGDDKAVKRLSDSNQPPIKKKAKKKSQKRLTDLDVDNLTESSDTDEYRGSNASEHSEEPEPSEDEYLPREFKKTRSGKKSGRTRSDDEFIDDDESSDYELPSKRRGNKQKTRKGKGRRGRRRRFSDSDEESEEDSGGSSNFCSDSSDDNKKKNSKKRGGAGRAAAVARPPSKWGPKQTSSSEEEQSDEEELEIPSASSGEEKTETGRPLRRAAAQVTKKLKDIEKTFDDYEDEEENEEGEEGDAEVAEETETKEETTRNEARAKRPIGTLMRSKRVLKSDDESDEFEPEEELEGEDEEDEEEEGTELAKGSEDEEGNEEDSGKLPDNKEKKILPNAKGRKVETNGSQALSQPKATTIESTKTPEKSRARADEMVVKNPLTAALKKEQKGAAPAPSPIIVKADPPKAVSPTKSFTTGTRRPAVRSRGFSSSSELQKQASSSSLTEHQNSPSTPSAVNLPPTVTTSQQSTPQRVLPTTPSSMQQPQAATTSHDTLHSFPPSTAAPQHAHQSQQHFPPYSFTSPYSQHQQEGKFLPSTSTYLPTSQPNPQLQQHHPMAAANYMQQFVSAPSAQYTQPQFVYQTLQPYGVMPQQMVIDPRTGQPIEPESLGHALAGAMNPEDL